MTNWKTDPLYRRIFRQVDAIRDRLRSDSPRGKPPEGFRIEEHSTSDWDLSRGLSTILRVWILDDLGLRLFPGLVKYSHDPGELRGAFWQYGLVRFSISEDRCYLALGVELGPGISRHRGFDIEGCGEGGRLVLREESLSGSF